MDSALVTKTRAQIVSIRTLADDLEVVVLEADGGYPYRAGQHVPVTFAENEKETHYYSIASAPSEVGGGRFELLVGKPKSGPRPPFVEGASVFLGSSGGESILDLVSFERAIHLVAMGTGVSPLRAIARESRIVTPNRSLTLLAGARSRGLLPFHDEFLAMKDERFRYFPVFSREKGESAFFGRVSDHLGEIVEAEAFFVVCGSTPMVRETRRRLVLAGIRPENIHGEGYGE